MHHHLTLQTTLADYEHVFGFDACTDARRERWTGFKKMVELVLAEGGQLWEWESDGQKGYSGMAGLAVLRDGVLVKQWKLSKT